jgi:hypothetical protein
LIRDNGPFEEGWMTSRAATQVPPSPCRIDDLADLLGQTLGVLQARTLVRDVAASLGVKAAVLQPSEAEAVLGKLAAMPGFVGIAAQMARTRLRLAALQRNLQR